MDLVQKQEKHSTLFEPKVETKKKVKLSLSFSLVTWSGPCGAALLQSVQKIFETRFSFETLE